MAPRDRQTQISNSSLVVSDVARSAGGRPGWRTTAMGARTSAWSGHGMPSRRRVGADFVRCGCRLGNCVLSHGPWPVASVAEWLRSLDVSHGAWCGASEARPAHSNGAGPKSGPGVRSMWEWSPCSVRSPRCLPLVAAARTAVPVGRLPPPQPSLDSKSLVSGNLSCGGARRPTLAQMDRMR